MEVPEKFNGLTGDGIKKYVSDDLEWLKKNVDPRNRDFISGITRRIETVSSPVLTEGQKTAPVRRYVLDNMKPYTYGNGFNIEMEKLEYDNSFLITAYQTIMAQCVDLRDVAIVDACLRVAKEAGMDEVFLIDKEFVLNALKKAAEPEPGWINVEERLPKITTDEYNNRIKYLVWAPDYGGMLIGYYVPDKKTWECVGLPITVTHWRSLPEPPEEEMDSTAPWKEAPEDVRFG